MKVIKTLMPKCTVMLALFIIFTSTVTAQQFDVAFTKTTITAGPVKYGVDIPYNLTIYNNGTDSIQNIALRDIVGDGYDFNIGDNMGWTVDSGDPNAVLFTYTGKIPPGENEIVTLILKIQPSSDPMDWDNTAEMLSFTDVNNVDRTAQDVTPDNNEDNATVPVVDIALTKEIVTTGTIHYGDTLTFRTTIINQGNVTLGEVIIKDYIPEGYDNPMGLNTPLGWTMVAVNPEFTFSNVAPLDMPTADIKLVLTMDMVDGHAWDNYTEVSLMKDQSNNLIFIDADSNPNSNTAGERSVRPGDSDDNYIGNNPANPDFEDDHDPAAPIIFDVAIKKERLTGPPSYSYGQEITYSIDVFNQGNMTVQDIIYKDTLPCGIEDLDLSVNPGWSYDMATRVATKMLTGRLEPATFNRDSLNLTVRPCFQDQYSAWTNITEIFEVRDTFGVVAPDIDSTPDDNFSNDPGGIPGSPTDNITNGDGIFDEDDHDIEAIEIVDMAIKKTLVTQGPYAEGDTIDFSIKIYNQGNVETTETFIEEFVPIGFTYSQALNGPLGWSQPVMIGASSVDRLANTISTPLDAGDSTEITIKLILNLDGKVPSDWYNYAHVLITRDSLGNNRFDDADSEPFTETIEERDIVPGGVGDDNIFSSGVNAGEDQDDHDPAGISYFDLALNKAGIWINQKYGEEVYFAIGLENQGVIPAVDIEITEYIPCGLEYAAALNEINLDWDYDSVSGQATFQYPDTLFPGERVQLAIVFRLVECDEPGAWDNIVEISQANDGNGTMIPDQDSTPDTDPDNDLPDGEDDWDIDYGQVLDLSLTKEFATPPTSTTVGSVLNYIIKVKNEGAVTATNVRVVDYIPCGLEFTTSTGWTANIGQLYYQSGDLAPGETLEIPLQLTIGTCPDGVTPNYTNVAEITQALTTNVAFDADSRPDDNPTNDLPGEDDIDSVALEIFDLSLEKNLVSTGPYSYGQFLDYEIIITNEGIVEATSYSLVEYLSCGLGFDDTVNSGWALNLTTGYLEIDINTPLAPGESRTHTLSLTLEPCDAGPLQVFGWFNTAEISAANDPDGPADDTDSTPDTDPTNDPQGEDDIAYVPFEVFDLSLEKTVTSPATSYEVGDEVTYQITVTNQGNVPANTYSVTDRLPCNLELSASATGWVQNPDGSVTTTITSGLLAGLTSNIELIVTVVECAGSGSQATNVAEISGATDFDDEPLYDIDSTPDNNDPDEDDQDVVSVVIVTGATIGDFVFDDKDGDGIQDFNELGISGVVVTVYNPDGSIAGSTTTDNQGKYEIDLPAGDYYIVFDAGEEYESTIPLAGNNANDSNITGDFGPSSTSLFTVVNGQDDNTIDAGFYKCVEIRGIAWYDVSEDDIRQAYENGINGLNVKLYRNVGGTFILWETQRTHHDESTQSDDGLWEFCVNPGTYYIEVVLPLSGLVRVRPFRGDASHDSDINNGNGLNTTNQFTLVSGQSKSDLGAGYYPMATVGNSVWHDVNINGLQDDGEPRIANIEIELYNENDELIDATTTSAQGTYLFDYIEKDNYYLKFNSPDGFGFTTHLDYQEDRNSDVTHYNGENTTDMIALDPGMEVVNIDAGLSFSVLPVTWVSVEVEKQKAANTVKWITALEINNSHYIVQKSTDGVTYENLGRVDAKHKDGHRDYSYVDENISYSVLYYRVMQVDYDGNFSYSKTVSVNRRDHKVTHAIYPNPVKNTVTISGNWKDRNITIQVFSSVGKLVKTIDHKGATQEVLADLSALSNGVYTITISDDTGTIFTDKVIKI